MKTKSTEEYRNNITLHLVRISSDLAHIKERVDANHKHLEKINCRVRDAERRITAIKTVGTTLTIIITMALTLIGVIK